VVVRKVVEALVNFRDRGICAKPDPRLPQFTKYTSLLHHTRHIAHPTESKDCSYCRPDSIQDLQNAVIMASTKAARLGEE
jgi:hypothetical protein